jgi:acyl-CoA reductase-like NAD-dependent aldehyde dehydrogenase
LGYLLIPGKIGGKEITTETTFDVISPNDGKKLWSASSVSPKEAVQAVEAAQTALKTWRKVKPAQIRTILLKAADIFDARKDELSKYMMEETGALAAFTGFNLTVTAENFRDVAGRAANILGAVSSGEYGSRSSLIITDTTNRNTWAGGIPVQRAVRSELRHRAVEWYACSRLQR